MSNYYLGQLKLVGFDFAPKGWALCNGQLLPINQNQALFALLGTTYGGDGRTTFALPNLQGRVPLHFGQGAGLSPYVLGEVGGTEGVTLTTPQIPSHNHRMDGVSDPATTDVPTGNFLAQPPIGLGNVYDSSAPNTVMAGNAIALNPGNQPHENRQPILAVNFIIALTGIFPPHN